MADPGIQIRILHNLLHNMEEEPRTLARNLELCGEAFGNPKALTVEDLLRATCSTDENNPLKLSLSRALRHWDYISDVPWSKGKKPNTSDRRNLVYSLLGLTPADGARLDVAAHYFSEEHATVIASQHVPWYTNAREKDAFYWPAYVKYLRQKSWTDRPLELLGESTKQVIERLADPSQEMAFRSKGLVVGYVQSGKTANFTGVIARAADAGYRLFIVLTGQTELLRKQTQRRLDKEMIGRELVGDDYKDELDFEQFITHLERPSSLGYFDWQRLTGPADDYQSLKRGIDALEFEKKNSGKPFYDPENLRHAKARLIVIKKNAKVMKKVIADLNGIRFRSHLDDIPALIIDDESDQASVNTKASRGARSKINELIVDLLHILPRSQYIGYTATPFANVFIDPANTEDLFPRDFILSLPRPPGYMGVADFYDFGDVQPADPRSNRNAFIRKVVGDDSEPNNLQKALDSFILSGALKLFRKHKGVVIRGQHHTMLVHHAPYKAAHRDKAELIRRLHDSSDYRSGPAFQRLETLYKKDFARTTGIKAPDMPMPSSFQSLAPFIAECLTLLNGGGPAVAMVNSEDDATAPDFEGGPVWKILVGGNKLSRGYTIEGLTISYYRRAAQAADTLMQMGRWFGFREGYYDLVRLFIGTEEQISKKGEPIDLYEAFGEICLDEEMFRNQLTRYASMEEPRILPINVPPLVPAHRLMPTSKNKMFNAKVRFENFAAESSESTLAPSDAKSIKHNWDRFNELLAGVFLNRRGISFEVDGKPFDFDVLTGVLDKKHVINFLKGYRWSNDQTPIQRVIEFLEGTGEHDPEIDQWLFLAPQQKGLVGRGDIAGEKFSVFKRKRLASGRMSIYSEPPHKILAEFASLKKRKDETKPPIKNLSKSGSELYSPRQAVFLYYTIEPKSDDKDRFPAFVLQYPNNSIETQIQFGVKDPTSPDAIVVPVKSAKS
jgi:hypothetical protein